MVATSYVIEYGKRIPIHIYLFYLIVVVACIHITYVCILLFWVEMLRRKEKKVNVFRFEKSNVCTYDIYRKNIQSY